MKTALAHQGKKKLSLPRTPFKLFYVYIHRDMSKAIDLYKEAAEEGDPSSMCVLGTYYMNGVQEGDNVLIEENEELANYYIGKAH